MNRITINNKIVKNDIYQLFIKYNKIINMEYQPTEIIEKISKYLSLKDIRNFKCVSQYYASILLKNNYYLYTTDCKKENAILLDQNIPLENIKKAIVTNAFFTVGQDELEENNIKTGCKSLETIKTEIESLKIKCNIFVDIGIFSNLKVLELYEFKFNNSMPKTLKKFICKKLSSDDTVIFSEGLVKVNIGIEGNYSILFPESTKSIVLREYIKNKVTTTSKLDHFSLQIRYNERSNYYLNFNFPEGLTEFIDIKSTVTTPIILPITVKKVYIGKNSGTYIINFSKLINLETVVSHSISVRFYLPSSVKKFYGILRNLMPNSHIPEELYEYSWFNSVYKINELIFEKNIEIYETNYNTQSVVLYLKILKDEYLNMYRNSSIQHPFLKPFNPNNIDYEIFLKETQIKLLETYFGIYSYTKNKLILKNCDIKNFPSVCEVTKYFKLCDNGFLYEIIDKYPDIFISFDFIKDTNKFNSCQLNYKRNIIIYTKSLETKDQINELFRKSDNYTKLYDNMYNSNKNNISIHIIKSNNVFNGITKDITTNKLTIKTNIIQILFQMSAIIDLPIMQNNTLNLPEGKFDESTLCIIYNFDGKEPVTNKYIFSIDTIEKAYNNSKKKDQIISSYLKINE